MPTFKIQVQIYQQAGSVLQFANEEPEFRQIYFVGKEKTQAEHRYRTILETIQNIVPNLQRLVHSHNRSVTLFKTKLDQMPTDEY